MQVAKVLARHATDSDSSGTATLLEVSTGYWHDGRQHAGSFDGEPYKEVQRSLLPDHLAILPNERGACSVEDGCGTPRTNRFAVACTGECACVASEVQTTMNSETQTDESIPLRKVPERNDTGANGSAPPRLSDENH